MASCIQPTTQHSSSISTPLPAYEGLRSVKPSVKLVVPVVRASQRYQVVAQKKVQKRCQIILTQNVENLGKQGQLFSVKTGYFRNYLFPFGKAKIATKEYIQELKLEEERKEAEIKKIKEEAESTARMLRTIGGITVKRKRGIGRQIFGSVTTQDVADIIRANTQREFDKRIITIPEIREVGEYKAEIKLHSEVTAELRLYVVGN
ncbi:hypothetical protein O6H91_02G095400 [Diphasiastrum complanatum]|uniref:Uncharacterized protein n=1 Tax=Diphasiastrum complanatum TaxID=34168 RepID=A0ACC2EI46_DIPCM|nr:hypothetical protein O6H91_02G095400 [Diphasiastrum complanatum]